MNYKKDQNDETVITRLNEETLKGITDNAQGIYIDGKLTSNVVDKIKEVLNQMDKTEFESTQFADFKDQFQWFIGFAIFFLLLDILFLERKTAWVKKLNLFNEN